MSIALRNRREAYDQIEPKRPNRKAMILDILASSSKTATVILSLLIVSTEPLTVFVPPTSKMKRYWPIKRGEILY